MSEPVQYSGFLALKKIEQEKAAAAATPVPETTVPPPTLVRDDPQPSPETTDVARTPVRQTAVRETIVAETVVPEVPVERYTRLDNWILDEFLPRLDGYEQLVMLRLYRLTLGFRNRPTCIVSNEKLAQKTRLGKSTVERAIRRLKEAGYIATAPAMGGRRDNRGVEFRILPPALPPQTAVRETVVAQTDVRQTTVQGTNVRERRMKENMKGEHESAVAVAPADVYEVRKLAVRVREVNHARPGYTPERFRDDVRMALIGAGKDCGDETLDEATAGMIPASG